MDTSAVKETRRSDVSPIPQTLGEAGVSGSRKEWVEGESPRPSFSSMKWESKSCVRREGGWGRAPEARRDGMEHLLREVGESHLGTRGDELAAQRAHLWWETPLPSESNFLTYVLAPLFTVAEGSPTLNPTRLKNAQIKKKIFFLATPPGLWDLSSLTRDWTWEPVVKAPSPNHYTTREFPTAFQFLNHKMPYDSPVSVIFLSYVPFVYLLTWIFLWRLNHYLKNVIMSKETLLVKYEYNLSLIDLFVFFWVLKIYLTIIKRNTNNRCCQGCREKGILIHC